MKIPYSKKCEIIVRGKFRGKVPWLLGRCTINEEDITLKYFFLTKKIPYQDIKKVREIDSFIEIICDKESFQFRLPKHEEIINYINKKIN